MIWSRQERRSPDKRSPKREVSAKLTLLEAHRGQSDRQKLVCRQCRFMIFLADFCWCWMEIEQHFKNAEKSTRVKCANRVNKTSNSGCEHNDTLSQSNVLWESVVCSASATPLCVHLLSLIKFRRVVREAWIGGGLRKLLRRPTTLLAEKTKHACVRRVQLPVVYVEARGYLREGAHDSEGRQARAVPSRQCARRSGFLEPAVNSL